MADRASLLIEKGERHAAAGKVEQARKAFRQALKMRPDNADWLHRLARLELRSNNPKGAVAPLRKLAGLNPQNHDVSLQLAAALEDGGQLEEAERVLRELIAGNPGFSAGHNNLGNLFQVSRDYGAALAAYERAIELQPGTAAVWVNAGNMLEELGRPGEAVERYARAAELAPDYSEAFYFSGRARATLGEPDAALADVGKCLALDAADQKALALKGVLLSQLGRHDEERALFDYDRFIRTFRAQPPEGYATIEDFNAALVEYIRRKAALEYNPERASTRGGWHSGNLLTGSDPAVAGLRSLLQEIFQTYVTELPAQPGHPFLDRKHAGVRLIAQAQLLESNGYLTSHIHPGGWVSSAYYLSVPEAISGGEDNPGWLEFGVPTAEIRTKTDLETRRVKPEPGMAVLFPSYFFHGTRPFESDAPRISLGVDLIATA